MFVYTALGDSITFGENSSSPARRYTNLVAKHDGAALEVLAHPGWTSGALTAAVLDNAACSLRRSSAVTIWVGGNDLAFAGLRVLRGAPATSVEEALAQYGRHLNTLVAAVKGVCPGRIVLCTQYNPFPNSPVAVQGIQALNAITAETAKRQGVLLAPTAACIDGRAAELISGYTTGRVEDALRSPILPVHPNDAGHRAIADRLNPILYKN
ncbi:SGNH/GDSL hydrolase family protein [Tumebacillus sp. ITR2]|uniref:SGNH/GDSL hydrolase family protein n=1 Tax=Tumebacillus amylolyticus TaxID=2801339 RepID=A0ABS1J749_9BACL|nr:SGNH/GDSL hydrolase family protein [Tumebacillus amylolyticus]MBL0386110.1 SGNH/GDSL hydrolase family protein [Tumebacillus amylolyticus]